MAMGMMWGWKWWRGDDRGGFGGGVAATMRLGLRGSKKLKPGALSLYVDDGHRTTVEAIGTYHLELPSSSIKGQSDKGTVLVKDHCPWKDTFKRGASKSKTSMLIVKHHIGTNLSKKLRSCSLHYSLYDKIPHRQWDCNSDYQEGKLHKCQRMEKAQGPTLEGRITFSRILIPDSEETTTTGREQSQGQKKEEGEPKDTVQPPPNPPKKDTPTNEEIKGKDEHPERLVEIKPPNKVVIHDDYPDQTVTIRGNLPDQNSPLHCITRIQDMPSHRAEGAKEMEHSPGQKKSSKRGSGGMA
nr:hypothetical protein [Tanacetum cinerariifolium]